MRYLHSRCGIVFALILATFLPAKGRAAPHGIKLEPLQVYTNSATRFQFPPRVSAFERESEYTQYDSVGRDIGVGYNDLLDTIVATVFVYPIAERPPNNTLKGHFKTCKGDVISGHPGAKLVTESNAKVSPGGHPQEGLHATFTTTELFAGKRQPLRSELYLFTHQGSFVFFRVTYPAGRQAIAESEIKGLIDGLPWP